MKVKVLKRIVYKGSIYNIGEEVDMDEKDVVGYSHYGLVEKPENKMVEAKPVSKPKRGSRRRGKVEYQEVDYEKKG